MTQLAKFAPQFTLTQWQQRTLQRTVVWFFLAIGILLGWVAAFLFAASGSGNGVFGVDSSGVSLSLVTNGLVLACVIVGASVTVANQRQARELMLEVLAVPPATEPVASAVLIRTVSARGKSDVNQLLYAAHVQGAPVRPVLVPVPQGFDLPVPGSGAWLVVNEQVPAFASFFRTDAEQHAAALSDPAFEKLTRVQRGLAVPGSTFLLPALVGVIGLLISLIGFSVVLGTFG